MKISIIEEIDKTRYSLLKWSTVGWALWFGMVILKELIHNNIVIGITLLAGLSGWIIWSINHLKLMRLMKHVNSDPNLKLALNDEFNQYTVKKSMKIGFLTVMATVSIFLVAALFSNISALIVCEVVIYVGVLSVLISSLVFNKD